METALFDGDPLAEIDARLAVFRRLRAEAPRFSEAFWEADDAISWLRVVRDEVVHSGRVRADVATFVEAPAVALPVAADLHADAFDLRGVPDGTGHVIEPTTEVAPELSQRQVRGRGRAETAEPVGA